MTTKPKPAFYMNTQKNNTLISFLQAFGIVLVVVGHSFYGNPTAFFNRWIYTFHMPLFMFISGFLLCYGVLKKGQPVADKALLGKKGFIVSKIKRLLVPYVAISSLAFLPKSLMNAYTIHPVEVSLNSYIHSLIYPWDNAIIFFWFLPTLFLIFMLVIIAAKGLRKTHIPMEIWVVGTLLLHLFNPLKDIQLFNIGGIASYLFYFVLGYYACQRKLDEHVGKKPWLISVCTLILSILLVTLPDFWGKGPLAAINGITFSVALANLYVNYQGRFMHHLFGASYAIYLFSWFPQVLSQQVFLQVTHAPWLVGTFLSIVTGIYLPWLIYKWIIAHKTTRLGAAAAFLTGH